MLRKPLLLLAVFSASFFLSGCLFKKAPAALQINTTPISSVYVEGKLLGKTPYQGSNFNEGEITIKLVPEAADGSLVSWESKVKLSAGVLTLIERDFAQTENQSSGQILTLEKIKDQKSASLSVISDPDGALIKANGEAKGFSPLGLEKISEGDYEILVSKDGFLEKRIKAKAVLGYKLILNVKLAQLTEGVLLTVTPSAGPTPSSKVTPSVVPLGSSLNKSSQVLIKETPTGWLRVRDAPSTGAEVAKVKPGEKYPLIEEKGSWYKIEYSSGKEGWISSQYAQKL